MPGESYSIALSAGAFMDLSGNAYAGLASGYTISTRALMGFVQVSTGNWDAMDYFDGKRYGSCGFVDPSNVLYLVGGINGTAGASTTSMMNDVWNYNSRRESSCSNPISRKMPCRAQKVTSMSFSCAIVRGARLTLQRGSL